MSKKTMKIWFGANKNGTPVMFAEEPTRNMKTGKWESKFPLVNSVIYPQICALIEKSNINFDTEIQYIEIVV